MNLTELKNTNVTLYLLNKAPECTIDRLKLIKLIWLADRLHLNKYGRQITKSAYSAMPRGPVASKVLDLLNSDIDSIKRIGNNQIAMLKADEKYLSVTDKEIIDFVWDKLKDSHQLDLVDFSHQFPEWKRFESYLADSNMPNSYAIVEEDFFEKNDFANIVSDDIRESSKEEFLIRKSIYSSFQINGNPS
ncbi:Panacea domain-containing protein [Sphingobacterium sp. UME9]|uniref:Panacea domain-containing protein n=1 Tax=Sphingobacterium sp. UME9 TaxID=1862316 RepID=UPI00160341D1|nr:Panacea domain-containing protein [Sphingobacterium sp. UME9]MBB1644953.1 hypothetical protein [Sphingobacterium sp. UME9]